MPNPRPAARQRAWLLAAAAASMAFAGCADSSEASNDPAVTLRLVIPDTNIREPDAPCSGASGFRFAHPQAPFAIENAAGAEVASGTLPEGKAEKAFNIDLGDERQPTVCVMMVPVDGVETLEGHFLVIDDMSPVPINPNQSLDGIPEVVLR